MLEVWVGRAWLGLGYLAQGGPPNPNKLHGP